MLWKKIFHSMENDSFVNGWASLGTPQRHTKKQPQFTCGKISVAARRGRQSCGHHCEPTETQQTR